MQDYPPLAGNGSQDRRDNGLEPHHPHDTGFTLWIAAASVVISLGVLLIFTQGHLKNGGAPFVITPPAQISSYPATDR
ncbi:hypothetical protein SAMN05877838_0252 [Hoeflea halophila]|uniref:Uncharacterized protein n=1 Tax=Hoeflea halophila TaxID=714899 RepID=A0A286HMK0_9HYPH|nr:hypothetical protein [Hoeflea halophila]SOE08529.1 hypothetical protein SAMN05877838_0252 [Hoeflea halophila]